VNCSFDKAKHYVQRHPLVLIGLMGAGKTSIGKRLASTLDIPFSDADQEIELAAGKTINEIFEEHGEAFFRDGERRVIARLLNEGGKVLATGGGAFMNTETRKCIREKGISVWLKADIDLLMARVMRRDTRPLLRNPNPRGVMEKLIRERYPVYAEADLTVDSRDVAHEVIVNEIIEAVANCPKCA
jgi:shikimate kinase